MTNSMGEIEGTDLILVTGSNTAETHPIIGSMLKRAVERRGAKLIIVDPRKVEMVRYAHAWLRPLPGTDVAWINGLMHVIIEEELWDRDYVSERTESFDQLRAAVAAYTPEYVARLTGINTEDLRRAARLYAGAPRAMILYAMGITQHTSGTDNVKSLANLAMLCGNVGIEGGGVNPLRGQNNVQGACDLGALPNVMTGYQPVTDPAVLTKFQHAWGTGARLSDTVGLGVTQIFPAMLEGKVKALYIMGENPVLSDPNSEHIRECLQALEFLVVQDIFMSETAQLADVVLPAASFAEKEGTFTNTERRVQRVRKAIDPPGEARPDWQIITALANKLSERLSRLLGFASPMSSSQHRWEYGQPCEIFDELSALTPIYRGINYERLERCGLQWPVPDQDHPGTPYLHKGRFTRGLGRFHAVAFAPPVELPDDEYPFYLSTGRIRYHYHTGTMTRRSRSLNHMAPAERIQMNPQDARRLGIVDDDWVRVVSRRGEVCASVSLTDRSAPGMVFGTFHFAEAPINALTNDALDPVSQIPEYKVAAVRVERIESDEAERIQGYKQAEDLQAVKAGA